jgi:triacylglycerol esterase/lipase EstA (alpha/beta hydrolase family)
MDLHHPFLTIENYSPSDVHIKQPAGEIDTLVVFVHGYQGSSVDLEKARNFMNIYCPNSHGLLIKSIEDEIDETIEKLGEMVAQEVRLHLINSLNDYKRINFIGYSLGGILARQSLKHLEKYKDRMNIFISFASPHAGIKDN